MADTTLEVLHEIHERIVDLPLRIAHVLQTEGTSAPVRGSGGQFASSEEGSPGSSGKPVGKLDSLTNLGRTIGGPLGQLAAQIQHFQAIAKAFDGVMKAFGPQAKQPAKPPRIPWAEPADRKPLTLPKPPLPQPAKMTWPGGQKLSAPQPVNAPKPTVPSTPFRHTPRQYKPPQFTEYGNAPGDMPFKKVYEMMPFLKMTEPPLPPGSPGTARRTVTIGKAPTIMAESDKSQSGEEMSEKMDDLTEAINALIAVVRERKASLGEEGSPDDTKLGKSAQSVIGHGGKDTDVAKAVQSILGGSNEKAGSMDLARLLPMVLESV